MGTQSYPDSHTNTTWKMPPNPKSRAAQKFRANHPYQHQMFSTLVRSAKQYKSKFVFQRESEEMNNELSNMVRNHENTQYRATDPACTKKRPESVKHVRWSVCLCEVRTIPSVEKEDMQEENATLELESACSGDRLISSYPDLLQPAYHQTILSLPDIIHQTCCRPARLHMNLPDLLQLCQESTSPSSSVSSSSPSSSVSSSSPSSVKSSPSFVSPSLSLQHSPPTVKENGYLQFLFPMDCEPGFQRQR